MNDHRNLVPSLFVASLLILGCGSSDTVMIGISGSYVEVADGDSTQLTVPLVASDTNTPLYFTVRCPDGYARCTVVLDNAPVEAKIGKTSRLTGRLEYRGETMYRFDVKVNVKQEPMQ